VERTLKIQDDITEQTAHDIAQALQRLVSQENAVPIIIIIDTPGGWVDAMNDIVTAIKACQAPVHGLVTGKAHSAGFLILQHCAKRQAYAGATILFHAPRITAETMSRLITFPAEEDFVEYDSELHREMIALIAGRSGRSQDEIRELAKQERIVSAQEALALGLIDEIVACEV
jgi:ATP-dependent protease ClpP protease subunit